MVSRPAGRRRNSGRARTNGGDTGRDPAEYSKESTVNDNGDWPRGLSEEVALLDATVDFFENEFSISFLDGYDDLDEYKYHIFKFPKGQCAIMRYKNTPAMGVTLIIATECLGSAEEMIEYFTRCLHLTTNDVIWRRNVQ
jgi:hypothetical protein